MHSALVIGAGFALLAAMCFVAPHLNIRVGRAALLFVPLWLIGAGINMAIGVLQAGYTVAQEFPIFLAVFAVPAVAAALVGWRFG